MDIVAVVSSVANIGFPAVMCVVLFWYMERQNDRHDNTVAKLTESLDANTKILRRMMIELGVDVDE